MPPGVAGLTEHVRIISVIGRFLEHSRIYYFQNGESDPAAGDYFIGSADWMERNLSRRVEAITPIEAPPLKRQLWQILQTCLHDRRQAWDMNSDGSYVQRAGMGAKHSQQQMIERTERRLKEATRLRRRKVQSTTSRRKR